MSFDCGKTKKEPTQAQGAGNSANHCTNMSPHHKLTIMHNSQTHHFAIDKPLFIIQLQFIPLWCAGRC